MRGTIRLSSGRSALAASMAFLNDRTLDTSGARESINLSPHRRYGPYVCNGFEDIRSTRLKGGVPASTA